MGINNVSIQPKGMEKVTSNLLNAPQKYSLPAQKPDTAELSNKKTIKKVGIAATITAVAIGLFYLLRGKKPPKKVVTEIPKMEITDEAKKIYENVDKVLHKKTKLNADIIEHNLKPKEKQGSWAKDDMKEFYTKLEKESDAKLALEKAAKEAEARAAKEAAEKIAKLEQEQAKKIETFTQEITLKPIEELMEINKSSSDELCDLSKILRNGERKFTKEEELRFDFLNKQEYAINQEFKRRKRNVLTKYLERNDDKAVTSPYSSSYLNKEESRAFDYYYDNYAYNSALREGADPSKIKEVVLMDKGFAKAPALPKDAVVYRAVHGHPVFESQNRFIQSLKEGVTIKDPSYMSTSTDVINDQFMQFAGCALEQNGVLMRIKLPKGTKGVYGGYNEYLLPRNSQIKINKIETIDGCKIADCEYILP